MKIALILPANGPADVIEAQRAFHESAGVQVVGATDQALVAEADWIIESEAGEFWWPRGRSLVEILEPVPVRYDAVQALVRPLVRAEGSMHRLKTGEGIARKLLLRVGADGSSPRALRGWFPVEVLRLTDGEPYDESTLRRGLEAGLFVEDTRLADALHLIRDGRPLEFVPPDLVDEGEFALDVASLGDADVIQAQIRLDQLEARLAAIESTFSSILNRRLRALARRIGGAA